MLSRSSARALRTVAIPGTRALATSAPRVAPRLSGLAMAGAGIATASLWAATVHQAPAEVDYAAVRESIADILDEEGYDDGSIGPVLVRLAWHASGSYSKADNSGGSNGANMRFKPESGYGANAGLDIARARLEKIKAKHPGITYADLYTLASVVAIEEMGGPTIKWAPGRTDSTEGSHYKVPDGRLPDAAQGASHVRDIFYAYGFNDQEITALAGAHALGRCHNDRSGFEGPWTRAPTTFSNEYFRLLLEETWVPGKSGAGNNQYWDPKHEIMMLPADMAFRDDPKFRKYTEVYAKDEDKFFADFAAAYSKLIALGVPGQGGSGGIWGYIKSFFG